jgi:tetratricopeptide (TPR) repeat protein
MEDVCEVCMKKILRVVLVLLITAVFLGCGKTGKRNETLYGVVALPEQKLGDLTRPVNADVAEELQWLAVQTACIGMYNNAQAGNYEMPDPVDYYTPADIRALLADLSGSRTRTDTFYGICFDYAQAAYDEITANQSRYEALGMRRGGWYIAGTLEGSGEVILYDPSSMEQADVIMNGVSVKENSRKRVEAHGGATYHAWLWLYGKDGTVYWIDPTWTDNAGYVWWGLVEDGKEVQLVPSKEFCKAETTSDDAFAYYNRGNANKNQKRNDQAIEDYNNALRLNPNNAEAFLGRGIAFASRSDFETAIADFTDAIRIDSNLAAAYVFRGRALAASVVTVTEIEEGFSDFFYIVEEEEITAEQEAAFDLAIADCTQAIRLDPNFVLAYRERADAYTRKGDYDRAIADYTAAIRLDPNNAAAYTRRGEAYNNKGDHNRALADYNQAIRLDPNDTKAYIKRAIMYISTDEYDQAIADFNQVLRIASNNFDTIMAYLGRGVAYGSKKNYDQAVLDLNEAIRLDTNNSNFILSFLYFARGCIYGAKGDYDLAIADFNQALRSEPNNTKVYDSRGYVYYLKGDYDRAIADYERALRIDPNSTSSREGLERARRRGW